MQKYLPSVPEQNNTTTIQSQWCTWCWSNNLIGGLVELVHSTILGIKTIPDLIGSLFIRKTIYLYTKVSTKEGIIKSINNTFMEKDYANVRYVFWCAELCGKCYTIRIFSFIFVFGYVLLSHLKLMSLCRWLTECLLQSFGQLTSPKLFLAANTKSRICLLPLMHTQNLVKLRHYLFIYNESGVKSIHFVSQKRNNTTTSIIENFLLKGIIFYLPSIIS